MALGARSGLKHSNQATLLDAMTWLNGLGSPFGFETILNTTVALLFEDDGQSQSRKLSFAEGSRKASQGVKCTGKLSGVSG